MIEPSDNALHASAPEVVDYVSNLESEIERLTTIITEEIIHHEKAAFEGDAAYHHKQLQELRAKLYEEADNPSQTSLATPERDAR